MEKSGLVFLLFIVAIDSSAFAKLIDLPQVTIAAQNADETRYKNVLNECRPKVADRLNADEGKFAEYGAYFWTQSLLGLQMEADECNDVTITEMFTNMKMGLDSLNKTGLSYFISSNEDFPRFTADEIKILEEELQDLEPCYKKVNDNNYKSA